MRKIILLDHVSLDGFVAGPNGEMDWINFDETMFDFVGKVTNEADAALYGRVTYQMMHAYWPTAGDQPNASKHDKEHSEWYNKALKIVISQTMTGIDLDKTKVIGHNIAENIRAIKQQPGKNILMLGNATTFHRLFNEGLIDELWLFVNQVVIGKGIPLFKDVDHQVKLELLESRTFPCGVIGLHYIKPF